MTPLNFCYNFQGFFEIEKPAQITQNQLDKIIENLKLVIRAKFGSNKGFNEVNHGHSGVSNFKEISGYFGHSGYSGFSGISGICGDKDIGVSGYC